MTPKQLEILTDLYNQAVESGKFSPSEMRDLFIGFPVPPRVE